MTTALNDSWWNSTLDDAMLAADATTQDYMTTSEPMIDLGPHPAFAHAQCAARNDKAPESFEKSLAQHSK